MDPGFRRDDNLVGEEASFARTGGGVPDIAALLGDAGFFVAHPGEGGDTLADLFLRGQAKAQPEARLGGVAVNRPFRSGVEGDAGLRAGCTNFRTST